jgi:putative transposase
MCRLLKVSSSGYYAWRRRPLCPRKAEDARLRELSIAIHTRSRGNYGMPRIWDELRFDHNVRCSGERVRRLMRQLGIKGAHRRRYRKTTERDASLAVAPDLMNRDFKATRPDQKYVADITYIRTWEGWLYLAIILDVFSRRIVGWAMGTTLHTELVVKAFEMAVGRRRARGAIAHSDQGCQYTA